MKNLLKCVLLLFLFTIPFACEDMDDNALPTDLAVKDFVWKGMNLYYLWQGEVPDLDDDRFANQSELNAFLTDFENPETLLRGLKS